MGTLNSKIEDSYKKVSRMKQFTSESSLAMERLILVEDAYHCIAALYAGYSDAIHTKCVAFQGRAVAFTAMMQMIE